MPDLFFKDEIDKSLFPASRLLKARKLRRLIFGSLFLFVFLCVGFGASRGLFFSSPPLIISFRKTHPDFLGREVQLKTLEKALLAKRWSLKGNFPLSVRVLWGIGGIGKTELAIKYANEHLSDYSLIWRFDCGNEELLEDGYRVLAERLKVHVNEKTPFSIVRRKVNTALEDWKSHSSYKPWLLIFDNLEEELSDEDLPLRGGAVLITARESSVRRDLSEHLKVPYFSAEEASELLAKITGEESPKEINHLAEAFDFFPLALNQVAYYIREVPSIGVAKYLESYSNKSPLMGPFSEESQYGYSLGNVWGLTLEKLKSEAPLALDFLEVCSHLAPDQVPLSWFEKVYKGRLDEIIRHLQRFSLITYYSEDQSISLHRLLKMVVQENQEKREEKYLRALGIVIENARFYMSWKTGWEKDRYWMSHAEEMIAHPQYENWVPEMQKAALLLQIGKWNYSFGKFEKIIAYLDTALALPSVKEERDPVSFEVWFLKGRALMEISRLKEGQHCLEKALELCRLSLGPAHPKVLRILNRLNMALNWQGKHKEAYEIGAQTLSTVPSFEFRYGPFLVRTYFEQGWNLCRLGKMEEAILQCQKSLSLAKEIDLDRRMGWSLSALGNMFVYAGEAEEGERFLNQAFRFLETIYPLQHPTLALLYRYKGEAAREMGKFAEAVDFQKIALHSHNDFGKQTMFQGHCLSNMGMSLQEIGNYEEALSHHKEATEIFSTIHGEQGLDMGRALRRLGCCLREMGRYEEAYATLQKAFSCLGEFEEDGHPLIASIWKEMGACLYRLGHDEEGMEMCLKSLSYWEEEFGREHPQKAKTLQVLGKIYRAMGEQEKAQEAILEAFLVAHRTYYEKHPHLKQYCLELSEIYAEANDLSWKQKVNDIAYPFVRKTFGRWRAMIWKLRGR